MHPADDEPEQRAELEADEKWDMEEMPHVPWVVMPPDDVHEQPAKQQKVSGLVEGTTKVSPVATDSLDGIMQPPPVQKDPLEGIMPPPPVRKDPLEGIMPPPPPVRRGDLSRSQRGLASRCQLTDVFQW